MIGLTLTHFRITAKLAEGGMGDAYRTENTQLDREVVIKVLPIEGNLRVDSKQTLA